LKSAHHQAFSLVADRKKEMDWQKRIIDDAHEFLVEFPYVRPVERRVQILLEGIEKDKKSHAEFPIPSCEVGGHGRPGQQQWYALAAKNI
jgi:hypothetical protein